MEFEIIPEPTAAEREAVLLALAEANVRPAGDPSAWWEAGVRESVEDEAEEPS